MLLIDEWDMLAEKDRQRVEESYEERDGEWFCKKCGAMVLCVTEFHPIWEGPFYQKGGFGRVHKHQRAYCPKCEERPLPSGEIIQIPPPGARPSFPLCRGSAAVFGVVTAVIGLALAVVLYIILTGLTGGIP